jgi:REP element-mobilizing transposase RayT
MAHSFVACHIHYVFSTKNRENLIFRDMHDRLWAFMGGIAKHNGVISTAIGGTDNHAHLLVALPAIMPIAKAVQLIKGGSSKWAQDTLPQTANFAWQEGYGAFSVGASMLDQTKAYVRPNRAPQGHDV